MAAAGLQIVQPLNGNALDDLFIRDGRTGIVFPGITAEDIYGQPAFLQRFGGVKGKLRGGNVFRMEKLTQEKHVLFGFHKRCSSSRIYASDSFTDAGKSHRQ